MLDDRSREKAQRQITIFTNQYRDAKEMGYNVTIRGLPTYETQEDFNQYRPQDAGSDFEHENEFIGEILKGLLANSVTGQARDRPLLRLRSTVGQTREFIEHSRFVLRSSRPRAGTPKVEHEGVEPTRRFWGRAFECREIFFL